MKRLLSAAAVMIVLGSGAALAQPMGQDGYGMRGHGHHDRGQGGMRGLRMLEAADLNGDNTVTRAEIEQLQTEEFAFRDRNGDGFLDEADASPMQLRMMTLREERRADRADRPNRREGRGEGRQGDRRGMDADQDGRISSAEFMARSSSMFDRLDANADGSVTPDELDAHMQARAERREERRTPWWRN